MSINDVFGKSVFSIKNLVFFHDNLLHLLNSKIAHEDSCLSIGNAMSMCNCIERGLEGLIACYIKTTSIVICILLTQNIE